MYSYILFALAATTIYAFKTEDFVLGKTKTVFHDSLSQRFSFDVCADPNLHYPDSVRLSDHSKNTSITISLKNNGVEHMIDNGNIGFGVYPGTRQGLIVVQAWKKKTGNLVIMELDLTTGQISKTDVFKNIHNIVSMCDTSIQHTVARRSLAQTAINFLRGSCRSLLSPISWADCRLHTTSICTAVAAAIEAADPIPGDAIIWFPICKVVLGQVCGQIGKHDPTSDTVCTALENYISDHASAIIG